RFVALEVFRVKHDYVRERLRISPRTPMHKSPLRPFAHSPHQPSPRLTFPTQDLPPRGQSTQRIDSTMKSGSPIPGHAPHPIRAFFGTTHRCSVEAIPSWYPWAPLFVG